MGRNKDKPRTQTFITAEVADKVPRAKRQGRAADKVPEFLREKDKKVLWVEPKTKPRQCMV